MLVLNKLLLIVLLLLFAATSAQAQFGLGQETLSLGSTEGETLISERDPRHKTFLKVTEKSTFTAKGVTAFWHSFDGCTDRFVFLVAENDVIDRDRDLISSPIVLEIGSNNYCTGEFLNFFGNSELSLGNFDISSNMRSVKLATTVKVQNPGGNGSTHTVPVHLDFTCESKDSSSSQKFRIAQGIRFSSRSSTRACTGDASIDTSSLPLGGPANFLEGMTYLEARSFNINASSSWIVPQPPVP